jgi:hypothetical protein
VADQREVPLQEPDRWFTVVERHVQLALEHGVDRQRRVVDEAHAPRRAERGAGEDGAAGAGAAEHVGERVHGSRSQPA